MPETDSEGPADSGAPTDSRAPADSGAPTRSTTYTNVAFTTTAVTTSQGLATPNPNLEALTELSHEFEFEVRGGLYAITHMPREAAVVS